MTITADLLQKLDTAIQSNNPGAFKKLFNSCSKADKAAVLCQPVFYQNTLLVHALQSAKNHESGCLEVVQEILRCSTRDTINQKDPDGKTAHSAAIKAGAQYVNALLEDKKTNWGISVDEDSNTPLASMLKSADAEFEKEILAKVAKKYPHALDRINKKGENILHLAISSQNIERIVACIDTIASTPEYIKDLKTLFEHKDGMGDTPLHKAFSTLTQEDAAVLLAYIKSPEGKLEADLLVKNKKGLSVIQAALNAGKDHIIDTCKGDQRCEQEIFTCLLESGRYEDLNNFVASYPDEQAKALLSGAGNTLLHERERLVRILGQENNAALVDYITTNWKELFSDRESAIKFFSCVTGASNIALYRELVAREVASGAYGPKEEVEQQITSLTLGNDIGDPQKFTHMPSAAMLSDMDPIKATNAVRSDMSALALKNIFDHCNPDAVEAVCLKLSECEKNGTSLLEKAISRATDEEISALLSSATGNGAPFSHLTSYGKMALREEACRMGIQYAKGGQFHKIKAIAKELPSVIYSVDEQNKSLLEIAADNGHRDVVQQIIALHKEIVRNASQEAGETSETALASIEFVARVSPKDAAQMVDEYTAAGVNIDKISAEKIFRGAALVDAQQLFEALERNNPENIIVLDVKEEGLQAADSVLEKYSQPSASEIAPTVEVEKPGKLDNDSPEFRDYGSLRAYATAIKKLDSAEFKRSVLDHFKTAASFTKTAMADGTGHTLFTVAASLGTPELMEMLLNDYRSKAGLLKNNKVGNSSTLGSPLQCAIIGHNFTMAKHLIREASAQSIDKHSNRRKENLLHTIVSSPLALELLSSFPKGGKKIPNIRILKALSQENIEGKTPLDLAIEQGEERTSSLLSFVEHALERENLARLIGSTDLTERAISSGSLATLEWIFDAAERFNIKSGKGNSLRVLGSKAYTHSLFKLACETENAEVARFLYRKVNEGIERDIRNRNTIATEDVLENEISKERANFANGLLQYLAESNVFSDSLFSELTKEANLNAEDKSFLMKQAVVHDNPDLVRNIPFEEIERSLDVKDMLTQGKDNLLSYLLKNSAKDKLAARGEDFAYQLMKAPGLAESQRTCAAIFADRNPTAGLSLHYAIRNGDLEHIKSLLSVNPSLIAKPGTAQDDQPDLDLLPYSYAKERSPETPEQSQLLQYLADKTVHFALNEIAREQEQAQLVPNEADTQAFVPAVDRKKLAYTLTEALLYSNDQRINTQQTRDLHRYISSHITSGIGEELYSTHGLMGKALVAGSVSIVTSLLRGSVDGILKRYTEQRETETGSVPEDAENISRELAGEDLPLAEKINNVSEGFSLLHMAAALDGTSEVLEEFIKLGGDPAIQTSYGANLAHLCAYSGMKAESGKYVFEELIERDPSLVKNDNEGKGILTYAALCQDGKKAKDMVRHIIASEHLDANLGAMSSDKQRSSHIRSELAACHKKRKDGTMLALLDEYVPSQKKKESQTIKHLRQVQPEEEAIRTQRLADILVNESTRSFNEITPLAAPISYVGKSKERLLSQQQSIFRIAASGQDVTTEQISTMQSYTADVFTSRDPARDISPLEYAISEENIAFLKNFLESRAGSEIQPHIVNAKGENLPLQLAKMIAKNPSIARDEHFVGLYKNLLESCGCTIQPSHDGNSTENALSEIPGEVGLRLQRAAIASSEKEQELQLEFNKIFQATNEGFESKAIGQLSTLARINPGYYKNAANPFKELCSNILLDRTSLRNGMSKEQKAYLSAFINDDTLRGCLKNVDNKGNNPLQSAVEALIANVGSNIGPQRAGLLHEVCSEIIGQLEHRDPALLKEVFLHHKNCQGNNFLETIAAISPSYDLFKTIEGKFSAAAVSANTDLYTVAARSANQSSMQEHLCNNYSLFPIGDTDVHGESRIHRACTAGDYDSFLKVMALGGNINLLDRNGNTPLQGLLVHLLRGNDAGMYKEKSRIIKTLVEHGSALHHRNNDGFTACDLANALASTSLGEESEIKCLDLIAESRAKYHDLRNSLKREIEKKYLVNAPRKSALSLCDLSGSRMALGVDGNAALYVSKMLSGKMCSQNTISSANLSFNDGRDKGVVEKIGEKRNYTVSNGALKLELSWRPKNGDNKLQKVNVIVDEDGSIRIDDDSIRRCGALGEKLNFNNCKVYVGGYPLDEAIRRGRWRDQTPMQGTSQSQSIEENTPEMPDDHDRSPANEEQKEDEARDPNQTEVKEVMPPVDEPDPVRQKSRIVTDRIAKGSSTTERQVTLQPEYAASLSSNSSIPEAAAKLASTLGNVLQEMTGSRLDTDVEYPIRATSKTVENRESTARTHTMPKSQRASIDTKEAVLHAAKELGATLAETLKTIADATKTTKPPAPSRIVTEKTAVGMSATSQQVIRPEPLKTDMKDALHKATAEVGSALGKALEQATLGVQKSRPSPDSEMQSEKSPSRIVTEKTAVGMSATSQQVIRPEPLKTDMKDALHKAAEEVGSALGKALEQATSGVQKSRPSPDSEVRSTGNTSLTEDGSQYEKQACEEFAKAFVRANTHFAMNIPKGDHAASVKIAQEISDAYNRITSEDNEPSLERSKLRDEIRRIFKENSIPCREFSSRVFSIRNGVISNPDLDLRFSSPFGFGNAVDGMILNSLKDIQEISDRSGVNIGFDLAISDLPLLPNATDSMKRNPGDIQLPTLGIGNTSPIAVEDGQRLLLSIANMSRPISKPQVKTTTHAEQLQGETSFQEKLRAFNNRDLGKREGPHAAKAAESKPQAQKLLSEEQRDLLSDMLFAISRELDHQPDIQVMEKDIAAKGVSASVDIQGESKIKATEETVGKSDTEETSQHRDRQDGKEKFDIQSAIVAEYFHNSLSHSTMPLNEVVYNMRNMLHKVASDGRYSEECTWALLNKACTDAGLNLAFDAANVRDLNNAGLQVYAMYRAHALADSDPQSLADRLRSEFPSILTKNNIRYVDTGNTPLTMKDGIIAGNNRVPEHFKSKFGYGSTMDSLIRSAAAYVGRIAQRASLTHTATIERQDLLRLTAAAAQIKAKHGAYNERYFDFNDPSPIPQEDGRVLLNHINNMLCLKKVAVVAPIVDIKDIENPTTAKEAIKSPQEVSSRDETSHKKPAVPGKQGLPPSEMLKKVILIAENIKEAFVPVGDATAVDQDISTHKTDKEKNTDYSRIEEPTEINSKLLKQLEQKLKKCVDMEGVRHSEEKGNIAGNFGAQLSGTARKIEGEGHSR